MDRSSHAPPRRLSYASVASGAAGPRPILSTAASGSHAPQYSDQRYGRTQSTLDQESAGISYRKPASLPSYSRRFNHLPGMTGHGPSGFFVPDYLRESRYVARLEADYMARTKRERQHLSGAPSNAPSLSSSATNTNVHGTAPSHRGMKYDLIESNPPKDEDELMPLPSRWSDQDRYPGLDINNNGLEVKYSGQPSKADIEAASVRADFPMSPACGLYYFEVTINSKSKDTAIAVGFSTAEASLERLPGWETHSWGYHGDDGKMFSGEHAGRSYGPTFSANDVVGCGIDFNLGQAFFTLNGRDLDVCFRELKDLRPFPTIGMKKYSGASVSVNFGQRPFVFDIQGKMDAAKQSVRTDIEKAKTSTLSSGMDESMLIQTLVAQYLAHDGYVETARAFIEELTREKNALNSAQPGAAPKAPAADETEAVHRQKIRSAILEGDIDKALTITQEKFPGVLDSNPQILFRLKCRKWVELISKAADLKGQSDPKSKHKTASNGFSKDFAIEDDFTQDMELDEQPNGKSSAPDAGQSQQYDQLLAEAMGYGQVLQREYRSERSEEWNKTLLDIFSLVAYENPRDSVHGSLLERKGRVVVAEELNSAILVSLGRSPAAALEKVYRQTEALIDVLGKDGGPATFVNLEKDLR